MINNSKLEVYILHEYDAKSHFSSLYKNQKNEKIIIKDYFILSKTFLVKRLLKSFIKKENIIRAVRLFFIDLIKPVGLKTLKNETLIVGIAPYNKLLNKYEKILKKNRAVYFTSWTDWSGNNFPNGSIRNKDKYEHLMRECFYSAACVTSKTEQSIKKFIDSTQVVNHAIETADYLKKNITNLKWSNKRKFLYLGQLIERKNINMMLKWIKENNYDTEFSFAGDGNLKKSITKLAECNKNVKYLGNLTNSEIKNKLKDYDFLILPSKDEPFGIVLIEALACGVPCIVSDCDGPKEIIEDGFNGYIFDRSDYKSFCERMDEAIIIDKENYIKLSQNSVESSKKYDNNIIFEKWRNILA